MARAELLLQALDQRPSFSSASAFSNAAVKVREIREQSKMLFLKIGFGHAIQEDFDAIQWLIDDYCALVERLFRMDES